MDSRDIAPTQIRPILGALLAVLAVMGFALGDTMTKTLASRHPVFLILAARYWINFLLLFVLFPRPRHSATRWTTQRTGLVILRSAVLCTASLCMGFALTYIPVGEATSIIYVAPLIVIGLAGRLLGEPASRSSWIGAGIGFTGILLIVRPSGGLDPMGVTLAMGCLMLTVAYHMLTRLLSRTETAVTLQFYAALIGALLCTPFAVMVGMPEVPTAIDLAQLMGLALCMTLGHYLFTFAYGTAPATLIAPLTYLQVFWAGVFGALIFSHVPDPISILGMAMVAGGGALVTLYDHLMARRRARHAGR